MVLMESERLDQWSKSDLFLVCGMCMLPFLATYYSAMSRDGFQETNQAIYQAIGNEDQKMSDIPM
ncbi:hypothetical protein COX97_02720 [Candidatus Pacearchaeota archaeon CG_4_10_14_0_2_um_filter_05_32_18]|nr:MAG: hypothetical protein COX97_02720 [Candidatus Pacearchaeota archaeon CG_4_10_14_0_2_um_filter_05_32_18]